MTDVEKRENHRWLALLDVRVLPGEHIPADLKLAMIDIAQKNEVPLMVTMATAESIIQKHAKEPKSYIYRVSLNDGIQTSFSLSAAKAPAWSQPRKVSELVHGMELMIGVDKSWLKGTVAPKQVNVDDFVITSFEASDAALELTLRKKLQEKEALTFHLRRGDTGDGGRHQRSGFSGQLPTPAQRALDW